MSARLLKKVLQEQEQQQLIREDEDGSESPNSPGSKINNLFDLLNDDGEDRDGDKDEDDDDGGVKKVNLKIRVYRYFLCRVYLYWDIST